MLKLVGQLLRGENPLHNDWSNMNEMDSAMALIKKIFQYLNSSCRPGGKALLHFPK